MTGPYVVTVKRGEGIVSRRAVATLGDARLLVRSVVVDLGNDYMGATGETAGWPNLTTLAERSPGIIGPLPDGTVIEVEAVSWRDLYVDRPMSATHVLHAEIGKASGRSGAIRAYNAAQEAKD